MTQRNYMNDRYRKGANVGSTRKSAAKAKPVRKQGSVEASSSAKSDNAKAKRAAAAASDGIERDFAGLPTSPEIKKWRRVWWGLLLGGLAMIGVSYVVPELRTDEQVLKLVSLAVLAMSAAAIAIDLVVIRKLRKEIMDKLPAKKKGAK